MRLGCGGLLAVLFGRGRGGPTPPHYDTTPVRIFFGALEVAGLEEHSSSILSSGLWLIGPTCAPSPTADVVVRQFYDRLGQKILARLYWGLGMCLDETM